VRAAAFDFAAAHSVDYALALLSAHGADARLLAGGQTLLPQLTARLTEAKILVDVNPVATSLNHIVFSDDGVEIGALTTQRSLEMNAAFAHSQPLAAAMIGHIANPIIRMRGTVGGSLAAADPAAEWGALALALDAKILARSKARHRVIAARDFYCGRFRTALSPDEMIVAVQLPRFAAGRGWSFGEMTHQANGTAIIGAAVTLDLDADGRIADARIAAFGAGDKAGLALATQAQIAGEVATTTIFRSAAASAVAELDFFEQPGATADYKKRLCQALLESALHEATIRAREGYRT